ncbi:MAG TPA: amidohydrolase family protein [Acidimicrobiia bacterium]|nr:amidohydrolase family protein [Acidimicrobiia bacterium]
MAPSRALLAIMLVVAACGGTAETTTSTTALPSSTTVTSTTVASTTSTTVPGTTTVEPQNPPDVIFYGGTMLTMNPDQPVAQAVSIRDGMIVAVGPQIPLLTQAGPDTIIVDLAGRTLMPGFVDAHTHILNQGNYGAGFEERQSAALANGITTLANMYSEADFLAAMESFAADGHLRVRTSLYMVYNRACGDLVGEWYLDRPPTREPGEMLRIGGVKVFADGGSCNSPSFTTQIAEDVVLVPPYVTVEELTGVIERAQAAGHQVAVHAVGDRAIDTVLDAMEAAIGDGENTLRHRIEHNSVVRPDHYPRYGEIGMVATIFAEYPSCAPFGAPLFPEYQDWEWPYDELLAANPDVHFAWHGDAPSFSIDPLKQLFGFVTRYDVAADGTLCEPWPWLADDTIPVEDALALMTTDSAYAIFRETEVGALRPGLYADLIVLSDNPVAVDPFDIKDIAVLMTMVGGQTEYCAAGSEEICP